MFDLSDLQLRFISHSGIFGYINYLVEKDRRYIVDTLVNGRYRSTSSLTRLSDADLVYSRAVEIRIPRI